MYLIVILRFLYFAGKQLKGKSLSLPLQSSDMENKQIKKTPLSRTKSNVAPSNNSEMVDGGAMENYHRQMPPSAAAAYMTGQNLHKKLQRQLTLNPSCDPRLYNLRRGVTRHLSCDSYNQSPPTAHTSVTRIASAPPPHSHPPPGLPGGLVSASDSQLHAWGLPTPMMPPPPLPLSSEEARRRMHYHLASIFPEEQVRTAMQLYPNETNPQKICAAILALFPSKQ